MWDRSSSSSKGPHTTLTEAKKKHTKCPHNTNLQQRSKQQKKSSQGMDCSNEKMTKNGPRRDGNTSNSKGMEGEGRGDCSGVDPRWKRAEFPQICRKIPKIWGNRRPRQQGKECPEGGPTVDQRWHNQVGLKPRAEATTVVKDRTPKVSWTSRSKQKTKTGLYKNTKIAGRRRQQEPV